MRTVCKIYDIYNIRKPISTMEELATPIEAHAHEIVAVTPEEYEAQGIETLKYEWRRELNTHVIIESRGYENKFTEWYNHAKHDRYFTSLNHIVDNYNNWILNKPTKIPQGFRNEIKIDYSSAIGLYVGAEVRKPNRSLYISGCDPVPKLTKEEKLKKKFDWIDLEDFGLKELEELDEWWEDMRYKEIEEYE